MPRWTSVTGWSWFCSERTRTTCAARLPFEFIADTNAAREHGPRDDGAVPLHDEGTVNGQAKPGQGGLNLDVTAGFGDRGLQFDYAAAGLRGCKDERCIFEKAAVNEFANFQGHDFQGRLVHQIGLGDGNDAMAQDRAT